MVCGQQGTKLAFLGITLYTYKYTYGQKQMLNPAAHIRTG